MKSPWGHPPDPATPASNAPDLSAFGGRPPSLAEAFDLVSRTPGRSPIVGHLKPLRQPEEVVDPVTAKAGKPLIRPAAPSRHLTAKERAEIALFKADPSVLSGLKERDRQLASRFHHQQRARGFIKFGTGSVAIGAGMLALGVVLVFVEMLFGQADLLNALVHLL